MKHLSFSPPSLIVFLLLLTFSTLFSSCGNNDLTNYKEKLIGEWELKNVGDLQAFYRNSPFLLKNATMIFSKNGVLETRMLSNRDKKLWIVENATWSVTQSKNSTLTKIGEVLSIKSDDGPFNDDMLIEFTDERTFYITLNELEYQFIKI